MDTFTGKNTTKYPVSPYPLKSEQKRSMDYVIDSPDISKPKKRVRIRNSMKRPSTIKTRLFHFQSDLQTNNNVTHQCPYCEIDWERVGARVVDTIRDALHQEALHKMLSTAVLEGSNNIRSQEEQSAGGESISSARADLGSEPDNCSEAVDNFFELLESPMK